ncbi:hypothetical protein [Clostridium butyricum]|uniref:hypothetical protein n=1 Tax=Clostridium butyricum TaxID=1492 RepID=UPI0021050AE1|nr:hypothetical protein [Clostridium butyricum]MCQ2015414.1 hypothetical protein [Clostridium butyricum]MCQ2027135.1 hypothetical protein [Clostridium butyricum]
MNKLIIQDDSNKSTSYTLSDYNISVQGNQLSLELSLNTSITIQYIISKDTREPDISIIKLYIDNQLSNVRNGISSVTIEEFLRRNYIYIGNDRRQFTAHKK